MADKTVAVILMCPLCGYDSFCRSVLSCQCALDLIWHACPFSEKMLQKHVRSIEFEQCVYRHPKKRLPGNRMLLRLAISRSRKKCVCLHGFIYSRRTSFERIGAWCNTWSYRLPRHSHRFDCDEYTQWQKGEKQIWRDTPCSIWVKRHIFECKFRHALPCTVRHMRSRRILRHLLHAQKTVWLAAFFSVAFRRFLRRQKTERILQVQVCNDYCDWLLWLPDFRWFSNDSTNCDSLNKILAC